ncbi:unnamed protein product [Brassica rapa]|uniref:Uncharacterized protein n=1 Tax=Brassica campestris TaxID=3711 RepID=A0A8D9CS30_BRACM|nr:unnamed protein product [Brassica rapa]
MMCGREVVPTVVDPLCSLGECKAVLRWDVGYRLRSDKDLMKHDGTGPRLALSGGGGEVCRGGCGKADARESQTYTEVLGYWISSRRSKGQIMLAVKELQVSDGKDATVKRRGDKDMRRRGGARSSRPRLA